MPLSYKRLLWKIINSDRITQKTLQCTDYHAAHARAKKKRKDAQCETKKLHAIPEGGTELVNRILSRREKYDNVARAISRAAWNPRNDSRNDLPKLFSFDQGPLESDVNFAPGLIFFHEEEGGESFASPENIPFDIYAKLS